MKKKIFYQIMLLLLISVVSIAQKKDNAELQKMYDEDQKVRTSINANIDWHSVSIQDSLRRVRVYELIREGKVITAKDYYHSAMIFQHGNDTIASTMAIKQMKKAIELDSTINKWLLAAAIDRDLMRKGKPQIYGTQYVRKGHNAKWEKYKFDTTQVTDEERKYYNVETLAEQKIKLRILNLISVSDYYSQTKSIEKTIELILDEKQKGDRSEYNITESGINSFAYELMHAGKVDDALQIFKLNTELYPNAYNAFDSYGECLMKLNKKKEALIAYKKSLDLNPNNSTAKKILEENK